MNLGKEHLHVPVFEVFGPVKRKYNKRQWMNESINEWMKFILTQQRNLESSLQQTANGKCQFLPCDWLNFPFTCCLLLILYSYTKISSFMPGFSIKIILHSFYLLISYFEKLSTSSWRLPFAVKVIPNLSNERGHYILSFLFAFYLLPGNICFVIELIWHPTTRISG